MKSLKYLTSYHGLPLLFVIFYSVGLLLFFLPISRVLFVGITPYTLVLVSLAVFYYHKVWNAKTIAVFSSIFVLSILVENIGVASGKLFGVYEYGLGLGIKMYHVPILIGLNWVVLVYGSNGLVSKHVSNPFLRIIGAAVLMVIYDCVLELAAPLMDMWQFFPDKPPIQNYMGWFILAILFHGTIVVAKINTRNEPGESLFIIQVFFFLIIAIGNSIFGA
jgi:bisanhydrobacterioruberin hydratase